MPPKVLFLAHDDFPRKVKAYFSWIGIKDKSEQSSCFEHLSKLDFAIYVVFVVALGSTVAAVIVLLTSLGSGSTGGITLGITGKQAPSFELLVYRSSLSISAASWIALGGMLVWKGGIRSEWRTLGFNYDTFRLFVRMRGNTTRLKLLKALERQKDRAELARDLDYDWKAIDWQLQVLMKHGLVQEQERHGKIILYKITLEGKKLLKLVEEQIETRSGNHSTAPAD